MFNLIFSSNSVYSTRTFLYNYGNNNFRLVRVKNCRKPGFEEINKKEKQFIDVNSEEVKRCSLSRTRRNIRELALCNDFEYFVTFTVNSELCDRYSLDDVQDRITKIFKKIKRNNNDFAYLIITEKHKNGAFHFHGLVKCFPEDDLYVNSNGYFCSRLLTTSLRL